MGRKKSPVRGRSTQHAQRVNGPEPEGLEPPPEGPLNVYLDAPIGLCSLDRDLRYVHVNERNTLFLVMAWSLFALGGPVNGQEVNSDVKIPPPRELGAAASGIRGLGIGTVALFTSEGQLSGGAVAQAALGRLSERETRDELGNFMTSLLIRAGIVAFDRPAALASSVKKSEHGSRPAWTGPTPMALSVGQRARPESVRGR